MVRLVFLVNTYWNQSHFHVIDIDPLIEDSLVRKFLRCIALAFLIYKRFALLYRVLTTFLIKQNLLRIVVVVSAGQCNAWVSHSILGPHSFINLVYVHLSKGLSVHMITSQIIVLIPLVRIV